MEVGLRPEIMELNPASRASVAEAGFTLHLGDATRSEVLSHAGIKDAGVVVVTTPDPGTAHDIIRSIRTISPDVPLVARGRYHRHIDRLRQAGADIVVDEEQEVGDRLAEEVRQLVSEFDMTALLCRLTGRPLPAAGSNPEPSTEDS
jgi:CPA2 family monovalent cation:H+ antiporter-2